MSGCWPSIFVYAADLNVCIELLMCTGRCCDVVLCYVVGVSKHVVAVVHIRLARLACRSFVVVVGALFVRRAVMPWYECVVAVLV